MSVASGDLPDLPLSEGPLLGLALVQEEALSHAQVETQYWGARLRVSAGG